MTTPIKIKRSGTASSTPSSLDHGELAINYADATLFWKDSANVIQSFVFQSYASATHNHDDHYYTESEVDSLLAGKAASSHTHTFSQISDITFPSPLENNSLVVYTAGVGWGVANDIGTIGVGSQPLGGWPAGSVGASLAGKASTTHASTHATGGSDALTPSDIGAAPAASPTFTGTVTVPGLTSTGVILADDSAAANSVVYSFDGDPNSGIGRAGADIVTVVTNGSERLRVDSTGNVGINGATNLTNLLTFRTTAAGSIASPVYDGIGWVYRTNDILGKLGAIEFVSRFANYGGGGLRFQLRNPAGTLDDSLFIDNQSGSATFGANFGLRVSVPTTSGSAGSYAPSLTFSGDSNTGFGQVSGQSDTASVFTAGHERVRVDSGGGVTITNTGTGNSLVVNDSAGDTTPFVVDADGKVGIRGATPSSLHSLFNTLCVGTGGAAAQGITIFSQSVCTLAFGDTAAGDTADSARGYVAYTHTTDTLTIGTNNATRITVDSTGKVGVNRTSPATALDVNGVLTVSATSGSAGSYAPSLTFSGDSNTGFGQVSGQSDSASVFTAGHERVRVKSTGAVRFVPLSADPASGEAGDVYYNSSTNKLRVYNGTSWVDLH